jgi:rhodanese-related sulfurtransferase
MTEQTIARTPRRENAFMIPRPGAEPGLHVVDGTWGDIQPITLAPGVCTIGELDVIEHIEAQRPMVDSRKPPFHAEATIRGAVNIPHGEAVERIDELDPEVPTVFFCNGPQCTATPQAVRALLDAGYPPEAVLYYRGGIHDWMTLGLPVETGAGIDEQGE